jgi:hypothetical protein
MSRITSKTLLQEATGLLVRRSRNFHNEALKTSLTSASRPLGLDVSGVGGQVKGGKMCVAVTFLSFLSFLLLV